MLLAVYSDSVRIRMRKYVCMHVYAAMLADVYPYWLNAPAYACMYVSMYVEYVLVYVCMYVCCDAKNILYSK